MANIYFIAYKNLLETTEGSQLLIYPFGGFFWGRMDSPI